jgi:endoglucanase
MITGSSEAIEWADMVLRSPSLVTPIVLLEAIITKATAQLNAGLRTEAEVGLRGARTAAFAKEPDLGVALDVTLWGDTPETKIPALKLGLGPTVKIMDHASISSPMVRDSLFAAAQKAGVNAQREVLPFGGTDAGAMQQARGGLPVGTVSIPCRYLHSACETIDMRDMDGALKLLAEFVQMKF